MAEPSNDVRTLARPVDERKEGVAFHEQTRRTRTAEPLASLCDCGIGPVPRQHRIRTLYRLVGVRHAHAGRAGLHHAGARRGACFGSGRGSGVEGAPESRKGGFWPCWRSCRPQGWLYGSNRRSAKAHLPSWLRQASVCLQAAGLLFVLYAEFFLEVGVRKAIRSFALALAVAGALQIACAMAPSGLALGAAFFFMPGACALLALGDRLRGTPETSSEQEDITAERE